MFLNLLPKNWQSTRGFNKTFNPLFWEGNQGEFSKKLVKYNLAINYISTIFIRMNLII